jgi:hypothetical protein
MNCAKCHTPGYRDDRYCRHCGGPIDAPADGDAPQAAEDPQVEQLLQRAFRQISENELDEAIATAHAALAQAPLSAESHATLGLIFERQERAADAQRQFETALQLRPESGAYREKVEALRRAQERRKSLGSLIRRPSVVVGTLGVAGLLVALGTTYALRDKPSASGAPAPGAGSLQQAAAVPPGSEFGPEPFRPIPLQPYGAPGGIEGDLETARYPEPTETEEDPAGPAAPVRRERAPGNNPRIGLPPVIDYPQPASHLGLPPAGIGELTPLPNYEGYPSFPNYLQQPADAPDHGAAALAGSPRTPAAEERPQTNSPRMEPIESATGFIRIEPVFRGQGNPRGPAANPVGSSPGSGVISVEISGGAQGRALEEGRRLETAGRQALMRMDVAEAARLFGAAQRVYETVARRGGPEAGPARQGAENCREALAVLAR